MKIKKLWLLAYFLGYAVFLGGCGGAGGGGGGGGVGNLSGTVNNTSYNPISNADIVVGSAAAKTLSNGKYSFTNIPAGEKNITINASGYTPAYRKATITGGSNVIADIAFLQALDSKTTPIPSSGGTATNTTGIVRIVFPNDGARPSLDVVLTNVDKIAAPLNAPEKKQFISYIVYAKTKPDNVILSSPAKLSVKNLTSVTNEAIQFYRFDTDTLEWRPMATGYASTLEGRPTIDVNTTYMGWIAAIMPISPAPGTIKGAVSASGGGPIFGANVWTYSSYAVTDSSGQYTLNFMPLGTTEVHASALNYSSQTKVVTVEPLGVHTANFSLVAASQGNISGTVRNYYDSIIEGARVVDESFGNVAYTDQYGRYTLYNVPLFPTNIWVYASGFICASREATAPASGIDLALIPSATVHSYSFTFEAGTEGFIAYADQYGHNFWHRQHYDSSPLATNPQNYFNSSHGAITRKVYLKDDGIIPTPEGGSYYFWYGQTTLEGNPATVEASYIGAQDPGDVTTTESGTGGESLEPPGANSGTLESPALNLTGYTFGKLSFWTWWEIEGKNPAQGHGYDEMLIFVSKGPPYTTWNLIGYLNPYEDPAWNITVSGEAYTSGGFNKPGIWVQHNYDLTPYAGDIIKIRFSFNTGDRKYNGFRGWFIDDIKVGNSQFGIFSVGNNDILHYPPAKAIPRN